MGDDTVTYTYSNRLRMSLSLAQPSAAAWTTGHDKIGQLTIADSSVNTEDRGYF
jgi:hypothetical protein